MQLKGRVITSIIIFILLFAAAILIWANQTGKITIWGEGDEIAGQWVFANTVPINQGYGCSAYNNNGHTCYSSSSTYYYNFGDPKDVTKVILSHRAFDDAGKMFINDDLVGGNYASGYQLSCQHGWTGIATGSDITGRINLSGANKLSFEALDCQGGMVGGGFTITFYKKASTSAPTVTFSANPASIGIGQSSNLTWTTTNATSVSISPNPSSGTLAVNGSVSVSPTTTTTYIITATGGGGTATAQTTVTVQQTPAPTVSLVADPSSIASGNSTTLTWNSSNATSLSINNGVGTVTSPSGSKSVSPTTTTTYTIVATGSAGTTNQASATVTITAASDTQPPTAPTNLTGTAPSCSEINLSWTAATDNVGVAGYEIFNADNNQLINRTTNTSWTITGAICNTTYRYYVKAYDAAGNRSENSNTVSVTTPSGGSDSDTQAPTKPTNLVAEGTSCSEIKLTWTASTDNIGVTGYDIYNSANSEKITTTDKTIFTFNAQTEKTTYGYCVKAHDAANNQSESSNSVSITTPACIGGQGGTGGTGGGSGSGSGTSTTSGGTNLLAGITSLVSTGQALWFNIIIAFIVAGIVGWFILKRR